MWREYFGFAGAAFAVINGLIAIFIALLPVRRSVLKLRLGATALVLAALAVGATFYTTYSSYIHTTRAQSERADTRERIENFILEGRGLLDQIRDPRREMPTKNADEWAQRAELYVRDRLGERYVARYRKDADDLYGDDSTVGTARLAYWRAVRNRVANLELIGAELADPPPVRP